LASCAADGTCTTVETKWSDISADQNAALAQGLIDSGALLPGLADQLQSTDPHSAAFMTLLNQAVSYDNPSMIQIDRALVNEQDGESAMSATHITWDAQAQANVEMGLIIPVAAAAAAPLVVADAPVVATTGTTIGAVSGGTGGYISGGWKGAAIGVVVGGFGGRYFPELSASMTEQISGTTGILVRTGSFLGPMWPMG
jgi:hypothetical protein